MRVVFIAEEDVGANVAMLCAELRRSGVADARMIAVNEAPNRLAAPDVPHTLDGGAEATRLFEAADSVHVMGIDPRTTSFGERTIDSMLTDCRRVVHLDGCSDVHAKVLHGYAEDTGAALFSTRPTRCEQFGATLLPPFIPTWLGLFSPVSPGTRGRADLSRKAVVHASSMAPFRRRRALEDLIDRAEMTVAANARVDTLVGVRQELVLRRRRHSNVALGAWEDGIGRSGLEALAQGVPLIAEVTAATLEPYEAMAGAPAPLISPDDLETVVGQLDPRAECVSRGAAWARSLLEPSRYFGMLRSAWES